MKNFALVFITLFFISCDKKCVNPSFEILYPNMFTCAQKIYDLEIERIKGIDINMYQIKKGDTLITFQLQLDEMLSQSWEFKIHRDSIYTFLNEKKTYPICSDSVDIDTQCPYFVYNAKTGLSFDFRVNKRFAKTKLNNNEVEIWIEYDFPKEIK